MLPIEWLYMVELASTSQNRGDACGIPRRDMRGQTPMHDQSTALKRCARCGETKPVADFQRRSVAGDGLHPWCRVCTAADSRRRYYEHPEQVRALIESRAATRRVRREEKRAEVQSRIDSGVKRCTMCGIVKPFGHYHAARNVYGRTSRCKDCANALSKQWREGNPDKAHAAVRAWVKANPDKVKASYTAGFARQRYGAEGRFTGEEWRTLCERHGFQCAACGKREALTVDHIIPLSKGGANTIDNIQPLCKPCNSKKWNKTIDYRK